MTDAQNKDLFLEWLRQFPRPDAKVCVTDEGFLFFAPKRRADMALEGMKAWVASRKP